MKMKYYICIALTLGVFSAGFIVASREVPPGYTGSPVDDKDCSSCHIGRTQLTGSAELSGLPEIIMPGEEYELTMTIQSTPQMSIDNPTGGFQLMVVDGNGSDIGDFDYDENEIHFSTRERNTLRYLSHKNPKRFSKSVTEVTWPFQWTAPEEGIGEAHFYFSSILGNSNSNQTGDLVINGHEELAIYKPMEGIIDVVNVLDCADSEDGAMEADVEYGLPPYTYQWSTMSTSDGISDLGPGSYNVTITDQEGQELKLQSELMAPPALMVSAVTEEASCNGSSDGRIDLQPEGGSQPYSFEWSNGNTNEDLENLKVGEYAVTVTDNAGCTAEWGTTITQPDSILYDLIISDETKTGAKDGYALVTNLQGSGPWSLSWSTGEKSDSIGGLAPGLYYLSITDAQGCMQNDSVRISTSVVTSVQRTEISDFLTIYPNPFTDYIFLETKNPVLEAEITLVDITGKVHYRENYSDISNRIRVDMLPNGVYFLVLKSKKWTAYEKLIK